MYRGTYTGPDGKLRGKTALLQVLDPGRVKVQFDDLSLGRELTHNWTEYPADCWKITGAGY